MGKLVVTIGVGDQQGRQFEDLEVTVDTGSTFTAVPRALLQRLGVPVRRSARSRLAAISVHDGDQHLQDLDELALSPSRAHDSRRRPRHHPLGQLN